MQKNIKKEKQGDGERVSDPKPIEVVVEAPLQETTVNISKRVHFNIFFQQHFTIYYLASANVYMYLIRGDLRNLHQSLSNQRDQIRKGLKKDMLM